MTNDDRAILVAYALVASSAGFGVCYFALHGDVRSAAMIGVACFMAAVAVWALAREGRGARQ